ncbi:MAG: DUF2161 family putative PD-(D/E)XK-type phosphodiesterase [Pseudomonadota bacterium]
MNLRRLKIAQRDQENGHQKVRETELYGPVKAFLEGQGYVVKAEVGAADVVACRDQDPPVIVELKTGFSLALIHQAIARQGISDDVYIAVPRATGRRFLKTLKDMRVLCRRLGLGLLTVRVSDGLVEAHLDPAPYQPRKRPAKQGRLLREFSRRVGDPNTGGTRGTVMTAYRQDALRLARHLKAGPAKGAEVARATGVPRATAMMAADHYGWFERVERGTYGLTPKGARDLAAYEPSEAA